LLQVRPIVFRGGIGLLTAVGVYLLAVHLGYLPKGKEFVVALLFSAGTVLAPLARADRKTPVLIAGVAFCVACLANTTLIEAVESRIHQKRRAGLALLALIGLALFYSHPGSRLVTLAAALSVLALMELYRRRYYVSADAFRVLADTALLSPLPIWLVWSL
jgi:hypothetical protein